MIRMLYPQAKKIQAEREDGRFFLGDSRMSKSLWCLDFRLLASRAMWEQMSAVYTSQLEVIRYGHHRKGNRSPTGDCTT